MHEVPEERKEVTVEQLAELQRAANVNMADIQVSGICTIFDKDGNIKGQMRVCSVEEAEAEHAEKIRKGQCN